MILREMIFDCLLIFGLSYTINEWCFHGTLVIIMTLTLLTARLVTGDDDGYIVFWDMAKCLDPEAGPDTLSYRSHNTYVEVRRRSEVK